MLLDGIGQINIKPQGKVNENTNQMNLNDIVIKGYCDDLSIYCGDKLIAQYYYTDFQAYPFMIELGKGPYIGKKGWSHSDIYNSLYSLIKKGMVLRKTSKIVSGRIWVGAKANDFNYALVMFWGDETTENLKPYIEEIIEKCKVNPEKVVIGVPFDDNEFKPIPLSQWNGFIHHQSPQENNVRNLHLMNARDKSDNTSDFRNTVNKKIGQKLTNNKGVEMPLAKYHSLIYQESKERRNIIISESQQRRIFRVFRK